MNSLETCVLQRESVYLPLVIAVVCPPPRHPLDNWLQPLPVVNNQPTIMNRTLCIMIGDTLYNDLCDHKLAVLQQWSVCFLYIALTWILFWRDFPLFYHVHVYHSKVCWGMVEKFLQWLAYCSTHTMVLLPEETTLLLSVYVCVGSCYIINGLLSAWVKFL